MLPKYIKDKIIKCNKLSVQHAELSNSIIEWLENKGVDVEELDIQDMLSDVLDYGYSDVFSLFEELDRLLVENKMETKNE